MTTWLIEPLASPSEIDAILAIEEASFTNPWTREMYLAELQNEGVSFFYLARGPESQTIGFCSEWRGLSPGRIKQTARRRLRAPSGRWATPVESLLAKSAPT